VLLIHLVYNNTQQELPSVITIKKKPFYAHVFVGYNGVTQWGYRASPRDVSDATKRSIVDVRSFQWKFPSGLLDVFEGCTIAGRWIQLQKHAYLKLQGSLAATTTTVEKKHKKQKKKGTIAVDTTAVDTRVYGFTHAKWVKGTKPAGVPDDHCLQIQWDDGVQTWEPWTALVDVDPQNIKKLRENPREVGDRLINLPGAHDAQYEQRLATINFTERPDLVLPESFQAEGKFCATNALALALYIQDSAMPDELYTLMKTKNSTLEEGIQLLRCNGYQTRKPEGIDNTGMLGHLQSEASTTAGGVYAVQYDAHCVVWDAGEGLIYDTDPRCRHPLVINEEALTLLGIGRIEKAYLLLPKSKKKRKV
jgi:hypothetical protein